jgi:hypothetical protein
MDTARWFLAPPPGRGEYWLSLGVPAVAPGAASAAAIADGDFETRPSGR